MRIISRVALGLCLTLLATGTSFSQSRGGFALFGGLSLPSGAFGKTDAEDAGFAKQGFFGGAEIMFSVAPGLGIVLDGRYISHKVDEDALLKAFTTMSGASVKVGSYTGILPMGGVRLYVPSLVGVYIDAQAGYMFAKSPSITVSYAGYSQTVDAISGKGLAYGASAGIDIGNTLVVGATYIMTKPKFDSGSGASATSSEQQMNMIHVFAGLRF